VSGLGPYVDIIIGERFGRLPHEVAETPWIDYLRLLKLLALESELQAYIVKLPTDQEIIFEGEE
jgi:hypothetical protein